VGGRGIEPKQNAQRELVPVSAASRFAGRRESYVPLVVARDEPERLMRGTQRAPLFEPPTRVHSAMSGVDDSSRIDYGGGRAFVTCALVIALSASDSVPLTFTSFK